MTEITFKTATSKSHQAEEPFVLSSSVNWSKKKKKIGSSVYVSIFFFFLFFYFHILFYSSLKLYECCLVGFSLSCCDFIQLF